MNGEQKVILGIALVAVVVGIAHYGLPKFNGFEITPETIRQGLNKPVIWLFYNDSEVNSRMWADFGARESRVINIPLLNLLYTTIVKANQEHYQVKVIGGLSGVAEILGGFSALPLPLQNAKARVTEPEEDWIRAAVLAKYGGLWLSPSVISLRGFGPLPKEQIVAFGQDTTPMYGSPVPGFRALWVSQPNDPMFLAWEKRCRSRLENQLGGRQVRGDAKSDWVELCETEGKGRCVIRVHEELGRDPRTNKVLELEDMLASGTEGRLPFDIPSCSKYLVIPYDDLLNRRFYGWILRSSEDQIMNSDIVLRHILDVYPVKHV